MTTYRPDSYNQSIPKSILSSGTQNAETFVSSEKILEVERCDACLSQPFPCENCTKKFEDTIKTSFSDYKAARESDDKQFLFSEEEFKNEKITDKPIPMGIEIPEYNFHHIHMQPLNINTELLSISGLSGLQEVEQITSAPLAAVTPPTIQKVTTTIEITHHQQQQQQQHFFRQKVEEEKEIINQYDNKHLCLWHMGIFDWNPIQLPVHFDETTEIFDEKFGCFCCYECMYAYRFNQTYFFFICFIILFFFRLEHKSVQYAPIWMIFKAYRFFFEFVCYFNYLCKKG